MPDTWPARRVSRSSSTSARCRSPTCASDEARRLGIAPPQFAAEGGEDFELLVALPPEFDSSAAETFVWECDAALTRVGTVVQGSGLHASLDGHPVRLMGFDHFR